jgi:hypothetical protein
MVCSLVLPSVWNSVKQRQQIPPQHWSTTLHCVTAQNKITLIFTAVRTSDVLLRWLLTFVLEIIKGADILNCEEEQSFFPCVT